jgi:pentose-5-phosphate-3-epimerase
MIDFVIFRAVKIVFKYGIDIDRKEEYATPLEQHGTNAITLHINKNTNALRHAKERQEYHTATPLLFQPPGPLQAHKKRPMAIHTLMVMAQKVDA